MKTILIVTGIALLCFNASSPVCFGQKADEPIPDAVIAKSIAENPANHAIRIIAGFHYFDSGDFVKAVENFAKASQLTPDDPYDQLWLYMAQLRQNPKTPDSTIKAFLARKESQEFVYTDIRILTGELTAMQAIEKARVSKDLGNLCEAYYYSAQRLLANGDKFKAREYLVEAIKTKKEKFWEYKSAVAGLQALK